MNYIDLNGEMVTPKTESMAYTQINQRMDVLERSIHSEITNTASVIDNRISDEINTVNGRITTEASVLGNRIDNIIAHNNDIEGNSELIDIRTGSDGTIYGSAGTAVREQVQELYKNIEVFGSTPLSIINFVTAEFRYRLISVSVSNRTKHSFTITNQSQNANNVFCGFLMQNLIIGKTYRVEFEFDTQSTFPENFEYYINVVTNSDMSGTQLGTTLNVRKGSFTFTATDTVSALRFITTSGCTQTVECRIYDNIEQLALSQKLKDTINALIENNEFIEERENPWKNKTWLAYGDSITAISNGDSTQNGWAKYVNNTIGFSNFYGRGVGGQTYVWNNGTFQADLGTGQYIRRGTENDNCLGCFCSWQRIKTMIPDSIKDDIDLIWLMGGTNDIANVEEATGQSAIEYNKPVFIENQGTDTAWQNAEEYNGGDYDVTTFVGAVASTIMKLQYRCPNAIIILSTPMPRWYTDTFHPTTTQQTEIFQNGEHHGVTTVDVADVEIKVARYMSIPYYDTCSMTGINGFNWNQYMNGVHPYPVEGQKMLARTVIGALKTIYPKIE